MRISILCSDVEHPVNSYLERWAEHNADNHDISLVTRKSDLPGGDLLFLISCAEIVSTSERNAYRATLVLHASALPKGRGWSPHIWQIIEGATAITLSLLEADDRVDSGKIWHQQTFQIPKYALWDEINQRLFEAELALMDFAINSFDTVTPREQKPTVAPTYYPKRSSEDSRVDPGQSIISQFDQIRVCDPQRYPAFFDLYGHRYKLILERDDE